MGVLENRNMENEDKLALKVKRIRVLALLYYIDAWSPVMYPVLLLVHREKDEQNDQNPCYPDISFLKDKK